MDYKELEKKLGYTFKDKSLLTQALTHRSYLNEDKSHDTDHNERIEFLGDAVLELVVTEYLFEKYPKKPEGVLTSIRASLVNTVSLAESGEDLNLDTHMYLSKGEKKDEGRARGYILANAFEAIIGALYLDGGYDTAKSFIARVILVKTDEIVEKDLWRDAKSLFQEKAQEHTGVTPEYRTKGESGPDHAKTFTVGVYLEKEQVAEGKGASKQEAETAAARRALNTKGW